MNNFLHLNPALVTVLTSAATQIIGAILLFVVGRWLIGLTVRLVNAALTRQKMDPTLAHYAVSSISGLLNVVLIISILGAFGVQTTTFAALFAAFGLAIGSAWGGLLSNFAAGVFMVVLRPFKVGDFIEAGGVTGTVLEIGPFVTKITAPDNVLNIVGNGKIFADNIKNYSSHSYRRVELFMQLNHDADVAAIAIKLIERLKAVPNVETDPAPDVEILEFNLNGPKLAVRPYCSNANYWQVYFDTNKTILELGIEAKCTAPEQHLVVRTVPG